MASARSLGTLTLDLIMKLGGFQKGAEQAARVSDKMSKKMKSDAAEITGAFKKIGATLGVGFGVQQIVSGLIAAGDAAIKYGSSINKAAIQTGESAETLSGLAYAAKLADVEFAGLTTGIIKLQKNISEASQGNKAAVESFAMLGLKVSDLKGLEAGDQLELVADAIAHIHDDADRTNAMLAIFGKAGADLAPLFEQGAEGIRKAREEAHALGLEMSGDSAKALDDAGDSIDRLSEAYAGMTRNIVALMAPALAEYFEGVAASVKVARDDTKTFGDKIDLLAKAYARAQEDQDSFIVGAVDLAKAYKEVADEAERAARAAPLGSKERTRAVSRGPGMAGEVAAANVEFAAGASERAKAAAEAKKAADEAARAAAERQRVEAQALDALAQRYEDTYKRAADAVEATKTESQKELDVLNAQLIALDQAAEAFPNMAEQYMDAKKKLEDEFLNAPLVTAVKVEVPPPPKTELDQFKEHMAGEMQDMVADFLVNPFDKGFDEILSGFANMIAQMIAQSLAADIVKKILGGAGGGGGVLSFFAGLFESGGFVPPGQFGIAGETGPEIVMGGRTGQTVTPMAAAPAPQVNLRNINAFDSGVIKDYLLSAQGEEVMLNFIERNGTRVRMASVGG